jgi:hypothetical protein
VGSGPYKSLGRIYDETAEALQTSVEYADVVIGVSE